MAEALPRKEKAYRCLIDAARALSSALGVDDLVDRILFFAQEVMQCSACSVSLVDSMTGDLIIRGTQPELKDQIFRVPAGKGISGRVFRTRQPENTPNAQSDSAHYGSIGAQTRTPAQGMLTIPLLDGEVCHGVMQAINPAGRECFDDVDQEILMAFGSLIATTLTRMKLHEVEKQKEIEEAYRRAELTIARQVLLSFMPPVIFETEGLKIRIFQEQAADVGGDFYAYHELADRSLLIAVGDASGKGVPAALESARACTLISLRAASCNAERLPEWLAEINNILHQTAERAGSLTTLTVLLVDPKYRRLRVCSFGQPRPRFLSNANRWEEVACPCHSPLGVIPAKSFEVACIPLSIGSSWLLLTDGFTEAQDYCGAQFGDSALADALSEAANERTDPLKVLETHWRRFCESGWARDDATALLMTDTTLKPQSSYECDVSPEGIARVRSYCEQWATFAGLGDSEIYEVVLACDEILTNVYKHAYHYQAGPLSCSGSIDQDSLCFVMVHRGDGLSSETDLPTRPTVSRAGGLGLPFIYRVFDRVNFQRTAESSIVTLAKSLRATVEPPPVDQSTCPVGVASGAARS
jgi:sigma-B regulation protein RsbU (phosphoserine phosphatase)